MSPLGGAPASLAVVFLSLTSVGGCDSAPDTSLVDGTVDAGDLDAAPDLGSTMFDMAADVAVPDAGTPDGAPDRPLADAAADGAPDGAGPDAAVPTPCAPCEGDDDCPGGLCLTSGLRGFCGADCASDDDCDDGFECVEGEDEVPAQCAPAGGLCPACVADDATCNGVDDDCDGAADEDFVGAECDDSCASTACVDGEVTLCPAPPEDGCDGADDDCDGAIDEDYAPGEGCGVGACAAEEACTDGVAACVEGVPAADDALCDGVDDDCDGAADEDFVTDAVCGEGVCLADAGCVDGEVLCTPGAPLAETDETCDGVDDDCDGAVDDECQRNVLGFELEAVGEGFVDVNLVYAQDHSPLNDGVFWQPRALDLRVVAPVGLTLRLPNNEGVLPGPVVVAAEKRVNVVRPENPRETRITIISAANSNRVGPGVLATLRYVHEDVAPPYTFGWNAERTAMAPAEALNVLSVEEATVP